MHQTVSIINSLKEQLKERNVKAALIKVEDSGPNVSVQDPSLISNNANTSVELNTPQQFCSGSQIFEPQVDTSVNMISIGDAPTSSSNVNSLAVSASGRTKATPFLYNQQTLCQHKAASNERASRNCPTMLWTFWNAISIANFFSALNYKKCCYEHLSLSSECNVFEILNSILFSAV